VNDAFRGVISVVALVALYYAIRVSFPYLNDWASQKNRDLRRHKAEHAFWMPASLGTSAVLAILTELNRVGNNLPVDAKSWARLYIVVGAYLGLRPLREHGRRCPKAERQADKAEEQT
jgi:hypothetical protein